MLLPAWSCAKCTPGMKKARGCYEVGKNLTELGDERLDRCPLRLVRDHPAPFYEAVRYYNAYSDGMLPEAGGLGDQSGIIMDCIQAVSMGVNQARAQISNKPPAPAPGAAAGPPRRKR